MGQRFSLIPFIFLVAIFTGCDKPAPPTTLAAPKQTIVSLSPAATDLIGHLSLRNQIVGVSAYEADADLKSKLPVVGDYERVDWEKMAELKPAYLIVQGRPDRLPPGLEPRCNELGIKLINIQIDRLVDIDTATARLSEGMNLPYVLREPVAMNIKRKIGKQAPTTPALILASENGKFAIGCDNFIDDLLKLAGGVNVLPTSGYPTIDQEFFLTLKPEVIIVLLPGANEQTIQRAKDHLNQSPTVPAVAKGKILILTRADVLLPSYTNAKALAAEMSGFINRDSLQPATGPATP